MDIFICTSENCPITEEKPFQAPAVIDYGHGSGNRNDQSEGRKPPHSSPSVSSSGRHLFQPLSCKI